MAEVKISAPSTQEMQVSPQAIGLPVTEMKDSPQPSSLPVSETKDSLQPSSVPVSETKDSPQPNSLPVSETKDSPQPSSLPVSETKDSPQPSSLPVSETKDSPQPSSLPVSETKDSPQPSSLPVSETKDSPQPSSLPVSETKASPQPSSLPVSETKDSPQPSSLPVSETKDSPQPSSLPIDKAEVLAQLTRLPVAMEIKASPEPIRLPVDKPELSTQPIRLPVDKPELSTQPIRLPVDKPELSTQPIRLPVSEIKDSPQPIRLPVGKMQVMPQPIRLPVGKMQAMPQPIKLTLGKMQAMPQPIRLPVDKTQVSAQPIRLPVSKIKDTPQPIRLPVGQVQVMPQPIRLSIGKMQVMPEQPIRPPVSNMHVTPQPLRARVGYMPVTSQPIRAQVGYMPVTSQPIRPPVGCMPVTSPPIGLPPGYRPVSPQPIRLPIGYDPVNPQPIKLPVDNVASPKPVWIRPQLPEVITGNACFICGKPKQADVRCTKISTRVALPEESAVLVSLKKCFGVELALGQEFFKLIICHSCRSILRKVDAFKDLVDVAVATLEKNGSDDSLDYVRQAPKSQIKGLVPEKPLPIKKEVASGTSSPSNRFIELEDHSYSRCSPCRGEPISDTKDNFKVYHPIMDKRKLDVFERLKFRSILENPSTSQYKLAHAIYHSSFMRTVEALLIQEMNTSLVCLCSKKIKPGPSVLRTSARSSELLEADIITEAITELKTHHRFLYNLLSGLCDPPGAPESKVDVQTVIGTIYGMMMYSRNKDVNGIQKVNTAKAVRYRARKELLEMLNNCGITLSANTGKMMSHQMMCSLPEFVEVYGDLELEGANDGEMKASDESEACDPSEDTGQEGDDGKMFRNEHTSGQSGSKKKLAFPPRVKVSCSLAMRNPAKAAYQCNQCSFRTTLAGLCNHKRRHHPRIIFFCTFCGLTFGIIQEMLRHYKTHANNTEVQTVADVRQYAACAKCNFRGHEKSVKSHVREHHKPKRVTCPCCDGKYISEKMLEKHLREMHSGKSVAASKYQRQSVTLMCDKCGFSAIKSSTMDKHISDKHGSGQSCNLPVPQSDGTSLLVPVVTPMQAEQSATPTSHSCSACGKTFTRRKTLNLHYRRTHEMEQNFVCDICNKAFFEEGPLNKHRQIHMADHEQKNCKYCELPFPNRRQLHRHEKKHLGSITHSCSVCGKSYATRAEVRRHMRTHKEERPFQCNMCDLSFKRRYRLSTHMITHTRKSSHVCNLCKKVFTLGSTLKRHRCKLSPASVEGSAVTSIDMSQIASTSTQVLGDVAATQIFMEMEDRDPAVLNYLCSVCHLIFSTIEDINEHVMQAHEGLVNMEDEEMSAT